MIKTSWKAVLLLFCNLITNWTLKESCDSIKDETNGVEWPSTATKTLSKPKCLDANKEFLYRTCSNGLWDPEPRCSSLQPERLSKCPDGFSETETFCYQLTPKSAFPPPCPFSNVLPFNTYKHVVGENCDPIWVPAKRGLLGFVLWNEPSWLYNTELVGYNFTARSLKDKNCLIYSQNIYELVSCKEEHRGICAYSKLDQQPLSKLCGSAFSCLQSDFTRDSTCFCESPFLHYLPYPKAEFLKPYQSSIYAVLTNRSCAIALEKAQNGTYVWTNSQKDIEYTYWSTDVVFDDGYVHGVATPNGWNLSKDSYLCTIFEKNISVPEPALALDFDEKNNRFLLTIDNPQSLTTLDSGILVYCFTNADPLSLLYSYPAFEVVSSSEDSVVYQFEPIGSAPGKYWCESFKYIDLSLVRTDKYFLRKSGYSEFVGLFQLTYAEEINPLSRGIIDLLKTLLFDRLNGISYNLRIMKLVDLDEDNRAITVNVHFSSTKKDMTDEDEYQIINETLTNIASEQISLLHFLSADVCFAESGVLTWPKTLVGSYASPKEFCFDSKGNVVSRLCGGNFLDGARWLVPKECEVFGNSSLTDELVQVIDNYSGPESIVQIYNISQNYHMFTPLDVYLVGNFFKELLSVSKVDNIISTVDNILQIDRNILKESQLKLTATDKFIHFMDHLNIQQHTPYVINTNSFNFVSKMFTSLSGVAVVKSGNSFVVKELVGYYSLDAISRIKNLECAIWLSPALRKDIALFDRVTVYSFSDDAFFQQVDDVNVSFIFGMVYPATSGYFDGPVNIIHRSRSSKSKKSCAYWSYNDHEQGKWTKHGKPQAYPPFLWCDFWFPANFAILGNQEQAEDEVNVTVTDNLIDLLDSNSSAEETMEQLYHISKKFDQFHPIDVSYVAQILHKVNTTEVNLTHLTRIVSNIQEIDRQVLISSQTESKATDKILLNVDSIASNFPEVAQVVSENLIILTINFKESFSGIALVQGGHVFVIRHLNDSIDEVIASDGFDSAVILSPELKTQIPEGAMIVLTVFLKDVLFNEGPETRPVNKIFGVVLPEIPEYAGPVSVLFKNENSGIDHQCGYWFYDDDIEGSWKVDKVANGSSTIFRCDFWHTTHFTHLIIEKAVQNGYFDFLDLVTSVNCVVSLVSLSCIILTGVFFKCWRENTGNQILLNFTCAIILQIIVFYISNLVDLSEDYLICTLVGVILHYTIVSQFCWMLVIAILQFRRFVIVLEGPPNSVLLKACVCGWVLPLLPVVCLFVVDSDNYVRSKAGLCYPSDLGLYLGVWLPICMVIVVNFVIFLITIYNVIHKKAECVSVNSYDSLYHWRLAVLLFFMLGFTWSFGFLALLDFGLTFEYLFCMTATLQGFILFLFFIVFNADTRDLYIRGIARYCKKKFK